MSFSNKIPRSIRRQVYVTAPGQTVFGPTTFKVFDALDVAVLARAPGASGYVALDPGAYTVSLSGAAPSVFTVTLALALAAGTSLRIDGRRLQERQTDVTQGGVIRSVALETELDRQSIILQELRRDADEAAAREPVIDDLDVRAVRVPASEAGVTLPAIVDRRMKWAGYGPSGEPAVFGMPQVSIVEGPALVSTILAAAAVFVPAPMEFFSTAGFYAAGDGGGARYKRVISEPLHEGKVQTADGAWWELASEAVNVRMFGASGNGVSNDAPAFTVFIAFLQAMGVKGHVPAGNYRIATVINPTVTSDIEIAFAAGARLIADAALNNRMFFFSKTTGDHVSLRVTGGFFDGSAQPNDNGLGTSAWDIFYVGEYFDVVHFHDIEIYNGEDYTVAGSDSGIFACCKRFRCTYSRFQGCWDAGIYLSADNALSNGEEAIVEGNSFIKCAVGLISKRAFRRYVAANNFFDKTGTPIATGETGTQAPGTQNIIVGNQIRQPTNAGIIARIADGTIIANNRIEDQGYNLAGVAVAGSSGIVLQGSANCVVQGNWIGVVRFAQPSSAHRAIQIQPRTLDGVVYNSVGNLIAHNHISNLNTGVFEENAAQDLNRIIFNIIIGAVTMVRKQGPGSVFIEFDSPTSNRVILDGTISLGGPFNFESLRIAKSAGVDFLNVAGGTGAVTVSTTGASVNVDMRLFCKGTGRIRYGTHVGSGDVPITGYIEMKDDGGTVRKLAVIA